LKASPFKIFVIFTILTIVGVFIIPQLSVKLNPSTSLPSITVSYSWTNASPYVLESGFINVKGYHAIIAIDKPY